MIPEPVEYPQPPTFRWFDPEYCPTDPEEAKWYALFWSDWIAADTERMRRESLCRWWEIHDLIATMELAEQQRETDWERDCREAQFMREREEDELNALLIGPAVDELVNKEIWFRAARFNAARQLLSELRNDSYLVEIKYGAVRVWPNPVGELAERIHDLQPELGDCLELEAH